MTTQLPNGVVIVDGDDPGETLGLAYGSSVDSLIGGFTETRQLQTFSWVNAAARNAQTGMLAGDFGYQQDTNVPYQYNGSGWVNLNLETSQIPSSVSISSGTYSVSEDGTIFFENMSSLTLNGLFDGVGADCYDLKIRFVATSDVSVYVRLTDGGSDVSGTYAWQTQTANNTSTSATSNLSDDKWLLHSGIGGASGSWTGIDGTLFAPNLSTAKTGTLTASPRNNANGALFIVNSSWYKTGTPTADGIRLYSSGAAVLSGYIKIIKVA